MKRKQILVVAILAIMAISLAVPTVTLAEKHPFTLYNVQCTSETGPLSYHLTQIWKYNSYPKFYVDHNVPGTNNAYSNLFHATRSNVTGATGILSGNKWYTPYVYAPIESNAIYQNYYYGLAARGNTKYYQYQGLTSLTLTGGFDPNLN